jgi:hypothetical protein
MSLRYARNLEPSKNQYARRWANTDGFTMFHADCKACSSEI